MEVRDDGFVQIGVINVRMLLDSDPGLILPTESIPIITKFVEGSIISVFPKRYDPCQNN